MTKQAKMLERLIAKPPPAHFTWTDLVSTLKHLGFEVINNSGSRRKFYHREKDVLISCHQPHPSPHVDKGCIVDVVQTLRDNGFLPS